MDSPVGEYRLNGGIRGFGYVLRVYLGFEWGGWDGSMGCPNIYIYIYIYKCHIRLLKLLVVPKKQSY